MIEWVRTMLYNPHFIGRGRGQIEPWDEKISVLTMITHYNASIKNIFLLDTAIVTTNTYNLYRASVFMSHYACLYFYTI